MEIFAAFLAVVVALKFAEATGGLDFDGWVASLGAAIVCWLGGWLAPPFLEQAIPELPFVVPKSVDLPTLAMSLGLELVTAMFLLLVAWTIVPGTHVKRFVGFFVASTLIVAFRYVATVVIL